MKKLIAAVALGSALSAHAEPAFWTGRMKILTIVEGTPDIMCEYDYFGRKFWQAFRGRHACPTFLGVEVTEVRSGTPTRVTPT